MQTHFSLTGLPPFRPTFLALLCALSATAHAQNQEASTPTLGTVVVTATAREQAVKEAPASISVITREEIEASPATNLRELVGRLEGVVISAGSPSDNDISIRGMPGEYTLFLVDGKRQNTRETMNRGTGGVQSNLLPPLAAIERIEVVRGPMSSLYGSDAMGGVINIITRKVPQKWGGSVEVGGVVQERSELGNTGNTSFWLGGPVQDDVVGLQIYGGVSKRQEDTAYYPNSGFQGAYGSEDRNLTAKATFKIGPDHTLSAEVGTQEYTWEQTPGKTLAPNGNRLRTRHDRDHWALTHEGRFGQLTTRVALQQEQASRTDWTNGVPAIASPDLTNTVLDAGLTTPLGNSVFKFGTQISRVDLEGISRQDAIPGSTYPVNVDKVSLNNWALYAEDEYFLTDRLTLTGGVRMDHDERYGNEWTPRLHGVYKLSEATTLRGGVSKGFKAPTIRQSTAGYCMTSGGPVANFQPPGTLCGNPDLKPETSTNTEIGLHHDFAGGSSVSATLFHNDFKNKVTSYDTGVVDPRVPARNIYVYDNISQVTLKGIELSASTPLAKNWKLSGNYTYTKSKRGAGGEPAFNGSSLVGQPLDRTPEHVLNAQVDWKASQALALFARVNAMSEQYWAGFRNFANGTLRRPGSATFDIGGSYDFNRTLSLKFALLNVADRVMPVDTRSRAGGLAGNWLVDEGRRLAVSLNAQF